MTSLPDLVVAIRPQDIAPSPYDAFVTRRTEMLRWMRDRYTLRFLLMRQAGAVTPDLPVGVLDAVVGELDLPAVALGRRARVSRLVRLPDDECVALQVRRIFGQSRVPTLTFGPWMVDEYRPIWAAQPSLYFYEEELARMSENAPQSLQARTFRRIERKRARSAPQPAVCVTISPAELKGAKRRFHLASHVVVPFAFSDDDPLWSVPTCGSGHHVAVVGNLSERRNAECLTEVVVSARQRAPELRFLLVSGPGLAPMLSTQVDGDRVQYAGGLANLGPVFDNARAVLVAASRVTGFKTAVLQGLIAGRPVVAHRAAAVTLGPAVDGTVLIGNNATELVDQLAHVWRLPTERRQHLGAAGRLTARQHFSHAAQQKAFHDALAMVHR